MPSNVRGLYYECYGFSGRTRISDAALLPYNVIYLFGGEPNGSEATVNVTSVGGSGQITGVSVQTGGTAAADNSTYVVGNELRVMTGGQNAKLTVSSVSGNTVTGVTITTAGTGYTTGVKATRMFSGYGRGGDGTGMFFYGFPDNADIAGSSSADIATCTARGQKVIQSIGGAYAQIIIGSKATADAIFDAIVLRNNDLAGFDTGGTPYISGIDWNNYEGRVAEGGWMTYVSLRLKDKYGSGFLITSAPAAATVQLATDREAMVTLYQGNTVLPYTATPYFYSGSYVGRALDMMSPQFYDNSSLTDQALVLTRLGTASDGFKYPITVNGQVTSLPNSAVGIGFSIGVTTSDWTTAEAVACYEAAVAAGLSPKGAYNWSDTEDLTHSFGTEVAPYINNNAETSSTTNNAINQVIGGTVVTTSDVQTLSNKTLTSPYLVTATVGSALMPVTSDGASLGTTLKQFSDLHLATGGVVNWADGDVTLTHQANIMRLGGTDIDFGLRVPMLGIGMDNSGDALVEVKTLTAGISKAFKAEADDAANLQFYSFVTGDSHARWSVLGNGQMLIGSGSGSADVNLYRSAANTLKTDDNLIVGAPGTSAGSVATVDGAQELTNKTFTVLTFSDVNGTVTLTKEFNRVTLAGTNSARGLTVPMLGLAGVVNSGSALIEGKTLASGGVQGMRIEADAAANIQFSAFVTGDSNVRFSFLASGQLSWGSGSGSADVNLYRSAANVLKTDDKLAFDATNTAGGTTGAQTINKPSGTVNFANGAQVLVVTNSFCTTSSIVYCVVRTSGSTPSILNVVPSSGSFAITLTTATSAETSVGFIVFN